MRFIQFQWFLDKPFRLEMDVILEDGILEAEEESNGSYLRFFCHGNALQLSTK